MTTILGTEQQRQQVIEWASTIADEAESSRGLLAGKEKTFGSQDAKVIVALQNVEKYAKQVVDALEAVG